MFSDPGWHLHGDGFQAKHLLAQDPRAVQTQFRVRTHNYCRQTSCVRHPAGAGPPCPLTAAPGGRYHDRRVLWRPRPTAKARTHPTPPHTHCSALGFLTGLLSDLSHGARKELPHSLALLTARARGHARSSLDTALFTRVADHAGGINADMRRYLVSKSAKLLWQ